MFDPTTLVGFHTWLSLVAIAAGFPVASGLMRGQVPGLWTAIYLATSVATSATGFLFPVSGVLPSHIIGAISLVLLALACHALLLRQLAGGWRRSYAITVMLSWYLLLFVLVAQLFGKLPALRALAPTQSKPPFAISEAVLLFAFVVLTWIAARRFTSYRVSL